MRSVVKRPQCERAQLTEKYGLENVEALIAHLEETLSSEPHCKDLKKAQKLRDQIEYLREERTRFVLRQRRGIIEQVVLIP
jgi:protein-arginine kinase activator protein McsA